MTKAIVFTCLFVISLVSTLLGMRYELAGDDENTVWARLGLLVLMVADVIFLILAIIAWGRTI